MQHVGMQLDDNFTISSLQEQNKCCKVLSFGFYSLKPPLSSWLITSL